MEFCTEHPEELTKVAAVQKKVTLAASSLAACLSNLREASWLSRRVAPLLPLRPVHLFDEPFCLGNCIASQHAALSLVQVDEVKNIMVDNIEKVLERGEKIELLVDKTDNLRFQVCT